MSNRESSLTQLDSEPLMSQAKRIIRASILTGEIEAGKIYSTSFFADRLGVSVTPVREALLDLATQGLVEPIRNRGFRVSTLTEADITELFELRVMLEVPAMARAAVAASPEQIAIARSQLATIAESARNGDLFGFLDADRDFHLGLLAILGNRRLVEIVGRLRDETRVYGLAGMTAQDLLENNEQHERLLSAIEARDAEATEAAMRHHLERSRLVWTVHRSRQNDAQA